VGLDIFLGLEFGVISIEIGDMRWAFLKKKEIFRAK
jgi:hypothetical protein